MHVFGDEVTIHLDGERTGGKLTKWTEITPPSGRPPLHYHLNKDGAHAPDEYYIIESTNPKIQSFDGAVMSFVEYLYELAK